MPMPAVLGTIAQQGQAGGAGVSVGLEMSMPGMGLNLQNLKQIKKIYL